MRRRLSSLGLVAILGIIGVLCVGSAGFAALPPQWTSAIEVPGTADLNVGGYDGAYANTEAVSCATPGNCAAGGYYTNQWRGWEAFVVDETNGTWGTAITVPGATRDAQVTAISCSTPGNCVAGGDFQGATGYTAFLASEVDGTWGAAQEPAGLSSLNSGWGASIASISCASPGNCVAGGTYMPDSGSWQTFVVSETNGTWGTAINVPGTVALNAGKDALLSAVSCGTPGNCGAVGTYRDASGYGHAFVVDETNGTWGTAMKVPGATALENGRNSWMSSISCASAGNCSAGGFYGSGDDNGGLTEPFVVDETDGTWGTATEVGGADSLNYRDAQLESLSCSTVGNCAAGGWYTDAAGITQIFVVDEKNGSWGNAIQLPGTSGLNTASYQNLAPSISCGADGACVVAGYYGSAIDATHDVAGEGFHAYVASESNGVWGKALELPGTQTLTRANGAAVYSVSCASAHDCAVGGVYRDEGGQAQAFVANSFAVDTTTLEPADAGGVTGGTTDLSARLTSGGNGVSGATVSFTLNGVSVGSAKTNASGVATLPNVSLDGIDVGEYEDAVGASFDGDDNSAAASSGSSSLTVYPSGLVGVDDVSVSTSGTTIDSFDSSLGAYSPTTNHGRDALVISNGTSDLAGVKVLGDATSSQGAVNVASTARVTGDIKAGTTASIAGTVGGTVTENDPSAAFSLPPVPNCSPYSAKSRITGTGTFSYSRTTGDLTLIKGPIKLVKGTSCFHSIVLGAGTTLTVSGPVTITLKGQISGSGHIVNLTNNPAKLRIQTSYSGAGGLTLQGSTHAYMTVFAPATTVTVASGAIFGNLFAGSVNLTGTAKFHADTP
ncbi:MAG: trimeric autotransporter adhesin [Gaiellaceae bacterium]|jgi:hypothetical protein|nr:trimeric autotransporter adhesin [Gaiellaceae bacterium]